MDSFTDGDSNVGSDTESCYSAMSTYGTVITDPIHKAFKLPKVCLDIIDTPEFQRLRALKQCGICNFVYPSATHSRFEHSLGVCHLALQFLQNCSDAIPADLKLCVLIAGLCHDLGHGPFSHLWERFLKKMKVSWKHEGQSALIFRYLVQKNNLEDILKESGLNEDHTDLICRLIDGTVPDNEKNVYLYELIANKETGIDVDKFEYIMRDSQQFGMPYTMDISRILYNVGIVKEDGVKHIGFREKIVENLRDVLVYRAKLHRSCYQHRTCKALELMLIDALVAANDYFLIPIEDTTASGGVRYVKLSQCHEEPRAFLKANDGIFNDLINSTDPNLNKSRMILKAMLERDLYTQVFNKSLNSNNLAEMESSSAEMESNMAMMEAKMVTELGSQWGYEFRYCFRKYSIDQAGDLSKVKYFTKHDPGVPCEMPLNEIEYTSFIKKDYRFAELLVFCTKGKKKMSKEEKDRIKEKANSIYSPLCG